MLHDQLNDDWFEWSPDDADRYRKFAVHWDTSGAIAYDGLLLDGWMELEEGRSSHPSPEFDFTHKVSF